MNNLAIPFRQLSILVGMQGGGIVAYIAQLLKTGQTTSYVTGDDGDYEKGIAKAYTVLTAGQYASTTNITLNGKTDAHSNNCVQDNNTGLMWSRYVSASVGPASDGKLPWTTNGNGEGAFAYCAAANAASLAGYTDWRVPNVFETASLANYAAPSGVPDATAFPSFTTGNIWASSTSPTPTTQATRTRYHTGDLAVVQAKTNTDFVLLVRGG